MIYLTNDEYKYEGVVNLPLLETLYKDIILDLDLFDAIVVTSKNSVRALEQSTHKWKNIPIYSIATPTTTYLNNLNANVVFTGASGHGNDYAYELIPLLKNKKILYLRASSVVSNLESILKENNIDLVSYIAYETKCKIIDNFDIKSNSTIIFTSPSTIECFLKNFTWDESNRAICIGKTTAKYIPKGWKYQISPQTSIKECIKLAKI